MLLDDRIHCLFFFVFTYYKYIMLSDIWTAYNAEDSWLPFYCPLIIWVSTFLYSYLPSKVERQPFHRWYSLHSFHNFGAILLGITSMYFNDDSVFNERIPILWSIGYFTIDLLDCGYRRDVIYSAHAIFCLVLGVSNYTTPLSRKLRMNSKASLCELSNGFMHLAKRTRKPIHFATFALVFTVCRILWIPYLAKQMLDHNMELMDPRIVCLGAFYGLNVFWWLKIVKILVTGVKSETKKLE